MAKKNKKKLIPLEDIPCPVEYPCSDCPRKRRCSDLHCESWLMWFRLVWSPVTVGAKKYLERRRRRNEAGK